MRRPHIDDVDSPAHQNQRRNHEPKPIAALADHNRRIVVVRVGHRSTQVACLPFLAMALKQTSKQVSPTRLKVMLLIAAIGPLVAIGLFLQSKGFFS